MKKIAFLLFIAAMLVQGEAAAQATELKLGHVGEPGSLFQISADEYAKRVNEKLAGKVKVVTYGSSQLGGDIVVQGQLAAGHVASRQSARTAGECRTERG